MSASLSADRNRSLQAFQRDLPLLWRERPGEWVAYRGGEQIGIAEHKHALYQQCFDQGLKQGEFTIFCIEPQETEMTLGAKFD